MPYSVALATAPRSRAAGWEELTISRRRSFTAKDADRLIERAGSRTEGWGDAAQISPDG